MVLILCHCPRLFVSSLMISSNFGLSWGWSYSAHSPTGLNSRSWEMALSLKGIHIPFDIALQVFLLTHICVEFFDESPYLWFYLLAQLLSTPSLNFFLKWRHQLLETFFLHEAFFGQMLLEPSCSLVGVEGLGFSFFYHHLYILKHYFEGNFLALFLYPFSLSFLSFLSPNLINYISYHFIKGWGVRIRYGLVFNEILRRLGFESLRNMM